ncbi:CbtA family protein [Streptomyces sp. NPDC001868]|uniref:CbtA family protein n=1 Tax=Streptomyces sp. NPDC001868 TaxID=3154401 RepID=UPI00332AF97E
MSLALVALDAVFLDQGALLSPMLGKIATSANYIHEFAHDGRHLLVRYPANPPGAGDPGTLDTRVNAWLAAMAIGVIAVALAWRVHRWLE